MEVCTVGGERKEDDYLSKELCLPWVLVEVGGGREELIT